MASRSLELRVGFTIVIAGLILTIGLMWFQGFKVGRSTFKLLAVFPMVGGIDAGDVVLVNGVEKGEVKRVSLRERDVLLTMKIDADVRIPDDSRIMLEPIGVMGERIVRIVLGKSDVRLEPGSAIQGVYDPGISEAISTMGRVMDELGSLAGDIRKVSNILSEGENLRTALENLAVITGDLRTIIEANGPGVERGISSFSQSAERMNDLLARNSERLDSLIVTLDKAGRELPEMFERMSEMSGALLEITRRLESDDTTLGTLIHDRELLDRLERAISSFDELVTDIRLNPKKYLKVEIF